MHLKKLILLYTNVTGKTADQGNKYFRIVFRNIFKEDYNISILV